MNIADAPTGSCLRVKEVAKKMSMGVSSVWNWVKENDAFPKPFKLGPNVTVWFESELDDFIAAQAAKTRV